jgi:protein O-mannosyl-transferase
MIAPKKIRQQLAGCLLLFAATLALYWPALQARFLNFDDNLYVTENARVQGGVTFQNVGWAFMTGHAANWHPLTWISHMLDWQMYGANPGGHHLTNLLFHAANAVLLFAFFQLATGAFWRSLIVAGLFAWHPVHVESVAWVSERKDVLSTFFWLLAMIAYVGYARRPGRARYAAVMFFFVLGLLAKPMVVTLPVALLLLDIWPLRRIAIWRVSETEAPALARWWPLILEKIPLLVLSACAGLITIHVQSLWGATAQVSATLMDRMGNAAVAYVRYVGKTICPMDLAVFYPHQPLPWWQVAAAMLMLATMLAVTVRLVKSKPYLAAGWLWFLITLLPVIGLIQAGEQSMADRYDYIPSIGLLVMIVWGVAEILARQELRRIGPAAAASLALAGCIFFTQSQLRYWHDSVMLFTHALRVTGENTVARDHLKQALSKPARMDDLILYYTEELRKNPGSDFLHDELGWTLARRGKYGEATNHYAAALRINPRNASVHFNYGMTLAEMDELSGAIAHLKQAVVLEPRNAEAHNQLGLALAREGKSGAAVEHYRAALNSAPGAQDVLNQLAWTLATDVDPAVRNGTEAVELARRAAGSSDRPEPLYLTTLGAALAEAGRFAEAVETATSARQLAMTENQKELADKNDELLKLYLSGHACHLPAAALQIPHVRHRASAFTSL